MGKARDLYQYVSLMSSRDAILQELCLIAMELCEAESAGFSIIRSTENCEVFSWDAVDGVRNRRST